MEVPAHPPDARLDGIQGTGLGGGLERQPSLPGELPQLLEMHLETAALLEAAIMGATKGDDRIKRILPPTRPPLLSVHPGMVDQENGDASSPKTEQPILNGEPSLPRTLAHLWSRSTDCRG